MRNKKVIIGTGMILLSLIACQKDSAFHRAFLEREKVRVMFFPAGTDLKMVSGERWKLDQKFQKNVVDLKNVTKVNLTFTMDKKEPIFTLTDVDGHSTSLWLKKVGGEVRVSAIENDRDYKKLEGKK